MKSKFGGDFRVRYNFWTALSGQSGIDFWLGKLSRSRPAQGLRIKFIDLNKIPVA